MRDVVNVAIRTLHQLQFDYNNVSSCLLAYIKLHKKLQGIYASCVRKLGGLVFLDHEYMVAVSLTESRGMVCVMRVSISEESDSPSCLSSSMRSESM